jgi:hypothetical protein
MVHWAGTGRFTFTLLEEAWEIIRSQLYQYIVYHSLYISLWPTPLLLGTEVTRTFETVTERRMTERRMTEGR